MPSDAVLPKCELTNNSRCSPDVAAHSAYWRATAASSSGVSDSVPGSDGAVAVAARERDRREHRGTGAVGGGIAQRGRDDRVGAGRQVGPVLLGRADRHQAHLRVRQTGQGRPGRLAPSPRHEAHGKKRALPRRVGDENRR